MREAARRRDRALLFVMAGLLIGSLMIGPAQDLTISAPRSGWVVVAASVTFGNPPTSPALGHCTASDCNVASQFSHVQPGTSSALAAATVSGAGTTVTTHVTTSNHHRFRVGKGVHTFRIVVYRIGSTSGDLTAGPGQLTAVFAPF